MKNEQHTHPPHEMKRDFETISFQNRIIQAEKSVIEVYASRAGLGIGPKQARD